MVLDLLHFTLSVSFVMHPLPLVKVFFKTNIKTLDWRWSGTFLLNFFLTHSNLS